MRRHYVLLRPVGYKRGSARLSEKEVPSNNLLGALTTEGERGVDTCRSRSLTKRSECCAGPSSWGESTRPREGFVSGEHAAWEGAWTSRSNSPTRRLTTKR